MRLTIKGLFLEWHSMDWMSLIGKGRLCCGRGAYKVQDPLY